MRLTPRFFVIGTVLLLVGLASCTKENNGNGNTDNKDTTYFDLAYGTNNKQKLDLYLPAGRNSNTRLLVLVHGGGWESGDKSDFNTYISLLQQKWPELAIATINYRLASTVNNVHHEEIMNDVKSAVQFLVDNKTKYVYSDALLMAGASAGAHLALLYTYAHDDKNYVRAVASIFGPTIISDWEWYNSTNIFLGKSVSSVLTNYAGKPLGSAFV